LEWERYGFETPVVERYKEEYGVDILNEDFDANKHRRVQGEFYTEFLRSAVKLIHDAGKRAQTHVMPIQMRDETDRQYMNIHWNWRCWLSDLNFDAITLKDGPWFDASTWTPLKEYSVPVHQCSYWKSVANKPHWQNKLRESLDDSLESGQAGFTLYESSMVARIVNRRTLEWLYPEIPAIFADFRNKQNISK
jgi:hypothetical protein